MRTQRFLQKRHEDVWCVCVSGIFWSLLKGHVILGVFRESVYERKESESFLWSAGCYSVIEFFCFVLGMCTWMIWTTSGRCFHHPLAAVFFSCPWRWMRSSEYIHVETTYINFRKIPAEILHRHPEEMWSNWDMQKINTTIKETFWVFTDQNSPLSRTVL